MSFDMSLIIIKVRPSLNHSLIGLKIKYILVCIIDKMEEIQFKYIDILCSLLLIPRSQTYSWYFQRKADSRFIDLQKLIMQRGPVQRAITFVQLRTPSYWRTKCNGQHLRSTRNAILWQVPVQRATTFAQWMKNPV